jgi:hypothetical protein
MRMLRHLLLASAICLLASSCKPAPTPAQLAALLATVTSTSTPSLPPAYAVPSTATPSPTIAPAASATPQRVNRPSPVVLTLDEARRLVVGWSNPDGSGRIGRAGYVAADDVVKTFAAAGMDDLQFSGGEVGSMDTGVPPSWIPEQHRGPIIFVEVAQGGMDMKSADQNVTGASVCYPVASRARYTVTAVFDAARGTYLGYLGDPLPAALWRRAATKWHLVRITPTPTATIPAPLTPSTRLQVTPTAATEYVLGESAGVPLAVGHVPTAVRPMVEVAPWVAGAWWSYRRTGVEDGIQWSTATVTETVEQALRLAPDVMAVTFDWRGDEDYFASPWGRRLPGGYGASSVYILPHNVIWPDDGKHHPFALGELRSKASALATAKLPGYDVNMPSEMIRLPLQAGDMYSIWSVGDPGTVLTPAGTFEGCYHLTEIVSARSGWDHWLCPGVGFVRHERWGDCSFYSGAAEVYELTDYHVPPIIADADSAAGASTGASAGVEGR